MTMTEEQAKEYIHAHCTEYFLPDRVGTGYICPICGSGSGHNGTGAKLDKDGWHFTCFSRACFTHADLIDIVGLQYRTDDYHKKLAKAAEAFGIQIEGGSDSSYKSPQPQRAEAPKQEAEPDYTAFFLQANKHIGETDYHRGLSLGTLNRFKVGYVSAWRHPKAPTAPASPRLIIPTSRGSYLARDTRKELTDDEKRYAKSKVGKVHIFNEKALHTADKPIFIVEGELDAMSIYEVGGEAVALGSVANRRTLLTMLAAEPPIQPLILSLDSDEAGKQASTELAEGLKKLGISFYTADISAPYKDPNEALNADRDLFQSKVEVAEGQEAEALEAEKKQLERQSVKYYLADFLNEIQASKTAAAIPTGFPRLDSVLDGGLYAGLYIVGAISSLGKTTFVLQAADQIAQSGQDVLIFSLEMARTELIAKSISRLTCILDMAEHRHTIHAKTTRGITAGAKYAAYSPEEIELIQRAVKAYGDYAGNVYITEGIGDIGVTEIREKVKAHIKITGRKPVVIIDYIQILAPYSERATDKQNMDKAVSELKRLSRDCNIPLIGISSLNRANYNNPIAMEAFKESGAVEYSSDVLIGLQLRGAGRTDFDVNAAKQKNPREIELVILKNRNGRTGDKLNFYYFPMFNYFKED